jgi:hypothetical protein
MVSLKQQVTQRPVAGDQERWLLYIEVKATNLGKTSLNLDSGTLRIRQLNPEAAGDSTLKIYDLDSISLLPGETGEAQVQTLYVPVEYKTLLLQSEYAAPAEFLGIKIPWKREHMWRIQTPVDIGTSSLSNSLEN